MKTHRSTFSEFIPSIWPAGLATLLLLLLTGCVAVFPVPSSEKTHGKIITPQAVKFIVPGQTTRDEVVARLGDEFRDSLRQPVLAYSWEKPAADLVWFAVSTESGGGGHFERSYWRAFFVAFDSGGRVWRTEFVRLSGKRTLDEQLEDWAQRHGTDAAIRNNMGNSK
jgi:hypothetical protein